MAHQLPQVDQPSELTEADLAFRAGYAMDKLKQEQQELFSQPSRSTYDNMDEVIAELTNQLPKITVSSGSTSTEAWAKENQESLLFLSSKIPIIPKTTKPSERVNRKPVVEKDCEFFIQDGEITEELPVKADRIVSWCVVNPETDECAITVCFDVDQVRDWMSLEENQNKIVIPKKSSRSAKETDEKASEFKSQLPEVRYKMYQGEKIQELFDQEFPNGGVLVPQYMTPEFEIVIREFDLIPTTSGSVIDRVLLIVQKTVTDFFQSKVENSEGLTSAFWKFTKVASTLALKAGRFAWKLAQNPLAVLLITTIAKMLRVFICVITNVDNAVEILSKIAEQFLKDAKSMSSGITKVLWELTLTVAKCAKTLIKASITSGATLVGSLMNCIPEGAVGITQGFFLIIKDILSRSLYGMLQKIGLQGFANFGAQVFENPIVILKYLTGDSKAAIDYDVSAVIRNFEFVDFQKLSIFLFMYLTPVPIMATLLSSVAALACPALLPLVGILNGINYKGMNILTLMKYVFKQGSKLYYVWKLVEELTEWVFDMIACTMNYCIDLIRHYFRVLRGQEPDPNAFVGCCMTKVIQDLIQAVNGNGPAASYQRAVINRVSAAKKYLLSWVPGGSYLSSATADPTEIEAENAENVISAPTDEMFVESEEGYDGREFKGTSVSGGSMMSRMYAALCDEREKIKLDDNPVFQLATSDGKLVNFYMFVWKPDAFFRDEQQMHVSVMAQEIEKIYPDAVLTFGKRKFLLLERLPREVINYILYMRNPIFDFNKLLSA